MDTPTVHQALAAVMAELPNISKADRSLEGYAYRGIEAVTKHLQPLLAKHGIVIVPDANIIATVPSPAMKEGWQDVLMHVDWTIYGPDGSTIQASTNGIGRDKSDKGSNKAQTQAFKYLVLHLFCIADGKDDTDNHSYEKDRQGDAIPAAKAKASLMKAAGGDKEAAAEAWKRAGLVDRRKVSGDELAAALDELEELSWSWHRPVGDEDQVPGGAGDREATDIPQEPAAAGRASVDTPPDTTNGQAPRSRRDIAQRAGNVFRAAYDAAPRGDKTRTVDRLRHALTWAATGKQHSSTKDCDAAQLTAVWARLDDIQAGRLAWEHDDTGVTFSSQSGKPTRVDWSDFDPTAKEPVS